MNQFDLRYHPTLSDTTQHQQLATILDGGTLDRLTSSPAPNESLCGGFARLVLFLKLETTVLGSLGTSFSAPSSRVLIVLLFVRLTKIGMSDMQDRWSGRRSRGVHHIYENYRFNPVIAVI